MTHNSRISSSFCRICRYVGLCGTLAGHGALLLPVWFLMHQADSALPPPVEASMIALHVVPSPAPPTPHTAPPVMAPEYPEPPIEPEKPEPIPEPEQKPEPIPPLVPESSPEPLPALEKAEIPPPPKEKPKERPKRKAPPPQVRPPVRTSPVASQTPDATITAAAAAAEAQAKQTLLSYLMAQFEKYKRYPASARKLGLEGIVHVSVSINAGGNIASIQLKGDEIHPILHKAATETIEKIRRNWQPPPTPHAVSVVIPLRYKLVDK